MKVSLGYFRLVYVFTILTACHFDSHVGPQLSKLREHKVYL